MIWLFSKNGCITLYKDFYEKQGEELLNDFVDMYNLINSK